VDDGNGCGRVWQYSSEEYGFFKVREVQVAGESGAVAKGGGVGHGAVSAGGSDGLCRTAVKGLAASLKHICRCELIRCCWRNLCSDQCAHTESCSLSADARRLLCALGGSVVGHTLCVCSPIVRLLSNHAPW